MTYEYLWQYPNWPSFSYSLETVEDMLLQFMEDMGRVNGLVQGLPDNTQTETILDLMIHEAIKTSAIEGEFLSREDVASSIRKNMGLPRIAQQKDTQDKRAEGIAQLMIAVRNTAQNPLSEDMLFSWHRSLMLGNKRIASGAWRTHTDPMQVISGPIGKEKIHYEAPPSERVPVEMENFVRWFNQTAPGGTHAITKAPVRSALVHLYFETIHPFEDGNGRIGRALSEKALSQGLGKPVLLSLSKTIDAHKKDYYGALKNAQRTQDSTAWIEYFVATCLKAQNDAEEHISFTLKKTKFFDQYRDNLNPRQKRVIERILAEGPNGFIGGMNAKKYMSITHASKATATRDLQDLLDKSAVFSQGAGRSTRYYVNL